MFEQLKKINSRPLPFQYYTVKELWTDDYTSKQMLEYHLDGTVDISSRKFSFIDKSVDWIEAYFQLTPLTEIADFGCGPGLYTSRLAKKNAQVTGIDFSENSLQYARQQAKKKSLNIDYICQNYLDYKTDEKFDLIIMIFCDFCALSPAQRAKLLKNFSVMLNPGGSVLLDGYSCNAFEKKAEHTSFTKHQQNGFWSAAECFEFKNSFKYDNEKVTLDKYTVIEEARTFTIYNWLQYFNQDSINREFEAAGLQIREFFADVAGRPFSAETDEFAVVAGKK